MYQPFLKGKNVSLRGLEEKDLNGAYFQWFNDQQNDFYTNHAIWPNSLEKMKDFFVKTNKSKNDLVLAIVESKTNIHIGNIGLHDINWLHRNAKLAIIIGEIEKQGQGYGSEAIQLVTEHAFNRLNLHRVYLGVRADNKKAIQAYQNSGFVEEGRMREAFLASGKYYDIVCMAKINQASG